MLCEDLTEYCFWQIQLRERVLCFGWTSPEEESLLSARSVSLSFTCNTFIFACDISWLVAKINSRLLPGDDLIYMFDDSTLEEIQGR